MSERIILTDGRWFSEDAATVFKESTTWDGNNHISNATGSQWEHEWLYYTRSGLWVLSCYSQYQGTPDSHEEIDEDAAISWLARMDCHDDDGMQSLPTKIREMVAAGLAGLEM